MDPVHCNLTAAMKAQEPELHGTVQAAEAAGIGWGQILIAILTSQGTQDAIKAILALIAQRFGPKPAA